MMVDRERCPGCGRKALRHRTRTDDYRCKECGEVYSARYFDVEDALLRLLRQLRDALNPVAKSYRAPERFILPGKEADNSPMWPGCLFVVAWIGSGIGIHRLTASWAWFYQWGAAVGGGFIAALIVGAGAAALTTTKTEHAPPSQPGKLLETEVYKRWCAANPVLASFDKGPFNRMLSGLMFFPEDPSHYEKLYVIAGDGMHVDLYQKMLKGTGITVEITDDDVNAVVKAVEECSTPSDIDLLRRLLAKLVPLTRTHDTTVLLEIQLHDARDSNEDS